MMRVPNNIVTLALALGLHGPLAGCSTEKSSSPEVSAGLGGLELPSEDHIGAVADGGSAAQLSHELEIEEEIELEFYIPMTLLDDFAFGNSYRIEVSGPIYPTNVAAQTFTKVLEPDACSAGRCETPVHFDPSEGYVYPLEGMPAGSWPLGTYKIKVTKLLHGAEIGYLQEEFRLKSVAPEIVVQPSRGDETVLEAITWFHTGSPKFEFEHAAPGGQRTTFDIGDPEVSCAPEPPGENSGLCTLSLADLACGGHSVLARSLGTNGVNTPWMIEQFYVGADGTLSESLPAGCPATRLEPAVVTEPTGWDRRSRPWVEMTIPYQDHAKELVIDIYDNEGRYLNDPSLPTEERLLEIGNRFDVLQCNVGGEALCCDDDMCTLRIPWTDTYDGQSNLLTTNGLFHVYSRLLADNPVDSGDWSYTFLTTKPTRPDVTTFHVSDDPEIFEFEFDEVHGALYYVIDAYGPNGYTRRFVVDSREGSKATILEGPWPMAPVIAEGSHLGQCSGEHCWIQDEMSGAGTYSFWVVSEGVVYDPDNAYADDAGYVANFSDWRTYTVELDGL